MKTRLLLIITALSILITAMGALAAPNVNMDKQFIAGYHEAELGMGCADCHGDDNGDGEVQRAICMDCHGPEEDFPKLAEHMEATMHRNPHAGHYIDLPCYECHTGHAERINFCGTCHPS